MEGPSALNEDTGTIAWYYLDGSGRNDEYEAGSLDWGKWDSRPPSVDPKSCRKLPDIDFIFEPQYNFKGLFVENGKFEDYEEVIDEEYEEVIDEEYEEILDEEYEEYGEYEE